MKLTYSKQWLKTAVSAFIILILLITETGCKKDDNTVGSNGNAGTPGANEVFIVSMAFSPASKTVAVGTTVKWINKESLTHTVTSGSPGSPSGIFNSGNLGQNGEFSFTFNQAGTFNYFCALHPSMTGTIIVQ